MRKENVKKLFYSTLACIGLLGAILVSPNLWTEALDGSCTVVDGGGNVVVIIPNGSGANLYAKNTGILDEDNGYLGCRPAPVMCANGILSTTNTMYNIEGDSASGWVVAYDDNDNNQHFGYGFSSCTDICVIKQVDKYIDEENDEENDEEVYIGFNETYTLNKHPYARNCGEDTVTFTCNKGEITSSEGGSKDNARSDSYDGKKFIDSDEDLGLYIGFGYSACTQGTGCRFGGITYYHKEQVTAYKNSVEPYDGECDSEIFTCNGEQGTWGNEDYYITLSDYPNDICRASTGCIAENPPSSASFINSLNKIWVDRDPIHERFKEPTQCEWKCNDHYTRVENECLPTEYKITFIKGNGDPDYIITGYYGYDISSLLPANLNKEGYAFNGWGVEVPSTMPDTNPTYTAQWNINQYTITFDSNGGSSVASKTQDYNTSVTKPSNPIWNGYTFLRWEPDVPTKMPAEDITVVAQWKADRYTVTFDANGGTAVNPITQDYDTKITEEPVTTREGHTFSGWYDGNTKVAFPYSIPYGDKTLVAHWDINEFTVAFDSKGGTDIAPVEGGYNTDVNNPGDPIWTGHTFLGWYYPNSNTRVYFPIRIPENGITLEAHWSTDVYRVTFNIDEGRTFVKTGVYGDSISQEPTISKAGYTFSGWYYEGTNNKVEFPYLITEDKTLVAHWDINQYKITFVKNNGEENYVITDDYGADVVEPEEPTKQGYIFLRWSPSVPSTMPAENKTVTAQWKKNRYTIIFNVNGGTTVSPITRDYETEIQQPETTRVGYEFSGWYDGDTLVTFPYSIPAEDKTLTAQWKILKNTIGFDTDGGTIIESIVGDYNDPVTPPADPIKTGYVFKGWNPEVPSRIPAAGITVTAQWEKNTYKIIFDTDGGNKLNPIEVEFSGALSGIVLPTPTKECNSFSGWNSVLPETMPANDITLKAVWNYTCSRSSGGGGGGGGNSKTSNVDTHSAADNKDLTVINKDETTLDKITEDKKDTLISDTDTKDDGSVKNENNSENTASNSQVNESSDSSSQDTSSVAGYTQEQVEAYSFAKSNGMTTQSTIKAAKMNTDITRIEMAKMLSYYAINVLGKTPDTSKNIKFKDVSTKMDKAYDNGVTLAYQLGIMGINMKNNCFKPNAKVTRAEFITALSRMVYGMEDGKGNMKYYEPHMARLYNEGVVNNTNPNMKEQRGNVMIMIKRLADQTD